MPPVGTLLLLRHATAENAAPGGRDVDRRLTARGRHEASGVGEFLRDSGLLVDRVLCSPAVRTRQTLELALDEQPLAIVELVPRLYRASADELIELVDQVAGGTLLVVGHSPAVPTAVQLLADRASSAVAPLAVVARGYPPATLARLSLGATGPARASAALTGVRIADGSNGEYVE